MAKSPELGRLHTYFLCLGNYWAAWALVIFLFNPIGDVFDTNRDGHFASLCERFNTLSYWGWPPFNSIQCLVAIHAPLLALFAGLRYRWTIPLGFGIGSAYILFMLFAVVNDLVNGDFPLSAGLSRHNVLAAVRVIGAVLWCVPAFLLFARLEKAKRSGIAYQRHFFAPDAHFEFNGRVVSYRLIWWCSTWYRLVPWVWMLMGVVLLGSVAYDLHFTETQFIRSHESYFIAFNCVFVAYGAIAAILALLSLFRANRMVRAAAWVVFFAASIFTALHLHSLTG